MQRAARLQQIVVRNRLHIAACATAGTWAWGSLLRCPTSPFDLALVASVVLCIYQWNRLTDAREDAINCPDELTTAMAHRGAIERTCILLALLICALLVNSHSLPRTLLVTFAVALGFAYGTPMFRGRPNSRLKSIFLIKNVSSSLGWSILTVLYPAVGVLPFTSVALWLAFGCMFSAVMVVELLWDMRDFQGDAAAGIRSVPVVLGMRASTILILILDTVPALFVTGGIVAHALRPAWIFVLVNTALVAVFVTRFDDFTGARRRWTHILVMTQTILLVGLGAVSRLL